jgi:hypothetical protein
MKRFFLRYLKPLKDGFRYGNPLARYMVRRSANRLVTPFTGFVLSQHFLSREIGKLGFRWLAPRSKDLAQHGSSEVVSQDVIYCQVDQLEEFYLEYLPRITVPYVLITGKESLPGLEDTETARQVLKDPNLIAWFSQNQIFEHLDIQPFPYGVSAWKARSIEREARRARVLTRRRAVYLPYCSIHEHLPEGARRLRKTLEPFMEPLEPFSQYLRHLSESLFILSPPGDRPDTYRHWEIIATGGVPVSDLPPKLLEMFEGHVLQTENLGRFAAPGDQAAEKLPRCIRSGSRIAEVNHWVHKIDESRNRFIQ